MKYWALIANTWRESWAHRTSLALAAVVVLLLALYAFGLQVSPGPDGQGVMIGLFGKQVDWEGPLTARGVADFSAWFALGLLSPWGLLLALFITVGLFTATFRPPTLSWLLAKPLSRPGLLLSKFAGAVLLVGVTSLVFLLGMSLLIAWKTGWWPGGLLLSGLLFVFEYAILASVALLVALGTRSTGISLMASILLYALLSVLHFLKTQVYAALPQLWQDGADALYLVLPKTPDLEALALQQVNPAGAQGAGVHLLVGPHTALWSSAAFLVVVLALSAWAFQRRDV